MKNVTEKAYAKINLTLDIVGKRKDGYHILSSVMQPISLFDIVSVNLSQEGSNTELTCSDEELSGDNNIVFKAANCFFDALNIQNRGIKIDISKNIPVGAGLGGGSADAACVLKCLNVLYETSLSVDELMRIGINVGADVPFCIYGKTALVQGIGEIITPLPPMAMCSIVLAKPCTKPSTGELYKKYDLLKINKTKEKQIVFCTNPLNELAEGLQNDFLKVWEGTAVFNSLNILHQHGAKGINRTGSGPVVYGIFDDLNNAYCAYREFLEKNIISFICEPKN